MEEETKIDPNAWALTFGDMITLLMTFFVLIISMSTIRIEDIVEERNKNEGVDDNIVVTELEGSGIFDEKVMSRTMLMVDDGDKLPPPVDDLYLINEEMIVFVTENSLFNVINLERTKENFMIRIRADILFEPGKAALKEGKLYLLNKIAELLSIVPNDVKIDGHTDDLYSDDFNIDNKLSIARATSVCRYLIEQQTLDPVRFAVAGYGKYKPILPNINDENRAKNRRVEIIIKERPEYE